MRRSALWIFGVVAVGLSSPAGAILTSNTGGKSSIQEDLARQISVSASQAIEAVSSAVAAIEAADVLTEGSEAIAAAVGALQVAEDSLSQAIETASAESLNLADPASVQLSPDLLTAANAPDATRVVQLLQDRMQPWPPSERSSLEFLLAETKTARAAVEMMRVGQQENNADMVRLGLLAFARYQLRVTEFSILWSLVQV
jgi:hypothetical protein